MNTSSLPYTPRPSRPLPGRVPAVLGEALGSAKRALLSRWQQYQTRRRERRAAVAVNEMDPHLLRDIGAPEQLIARAVEGRRSSPWRDVPLRLTMALAAIVVIGAVAPASVAEAAGVTETAKPDSKAPLVGTFTGELAAGARVYRFPTVIVAGSRRAEPGRSETCVAQPRSPKGATAKGHV